MFTGINGDLLYGRIEELAVAGKELMVTEFDIQDSNHVRKAEDLEDFMRVAFSHPEISMILLWPRLKNRKSFRRPSTIFWRPSMKTLFFF